MGEMWQNASEEEKSPYVAMSNQDKARYQAELESYNFRLAQKLFIQTSSKIPKSSVDLVSCLSPCEYMHGCPVKPESCRCKSALPADVCTLPARL